MNLVLSLGYKDSLKYLDYIGPAIKSQVYFSGKHWLFHQSIKLKFLKSEIKLIP